MTELSSDIPFASLRQDPDLRMDTARTIASRMMTENDRLTVFTYDRLGVPIAEVPDFFRSAFTDSYATLIERWIKFPIPQAAIFGKKDAIADGISDGDWFQLTDAATDPTISRLSADDIKRIAAFHQSHMKDMALLSPPEMRFDGMTRTLTTAIEQSDSDGKTPGFYYQDEEAYRQLISSTFDPSEYTLGWQNIAHMFDETLLIRIGVNHAVQLRSALSREPLPSEEDLREKIETAIAKVQSNPDSMREISTIAGKGQAAILEYSQLQRDRFWGHQELPIAS